jgi:hypothetical protein
MGKNMESIGFPVKKTLPEGLDQDLPGLRVDLVDLAVRAAHPDVVLVLPGDLNHYGFLFGGRLLAWIDEASWIAASLDYPHCQFVTVALDAVEFHLDRHRTYA